MLKCTNVKCWTTSLWWLLPALAVPTLFQTIPSSPAPKLLFPVDSLHLISSSIPKTRRFCNLFGDKSRGMSAPKGPIFKRMVLVPSFQGMSIIFLLSFGSYFKMFVPHKTVSLKKKVHLIQYDIPLLLFVHFCGTCSSQFPSLTFKENHLKGK